MNVILVLSCMAGAAFFAGIETGLLSADQLSLYLKKESGVSYARSADFLLLKPERLLGTTLIGTNLCVVTAAIAVASSLRQRGLAESAWIASLGLSLVLLVFTEVIPKSLAPKIIIPNQRPAIIFIIDIYGVQGCVEKAQITAGVGD